MSDDDSEREKRKLLFEQVARAIKEDPGNHVEKLAELGFTWVDDELDEEEIEERAATIRSDNEKYLVGYFEGERDLSEQVLDIYLAEKNSESLNYPLFRSYFRRGNIKLKELLLYGPEKHPTDIGLLSDLAYYHEFRNVLGELIRCYLRACDKEQDMGNFEELVAGFYFDTHADGYDAICELEQRNPAGSQKRRIIDKVVEQTRTEPERIKI
jgi:hypothetical protein